LVRLPYAFSLTFLFASSCGSPIETTDDGPAAPDDLSGAVDLAMPGGCSPKCGGLTPFCNATHHCVTCLQDGDCPLGTYCKIISDAIASCTPGCMSDDRCAPAQKCCGGRCADPQTDVKNCGGCDMACGAIHAAASCVGGQCMSGKCDPGWGDCNNDAKDGCESNLHSDPTNCTACGAKCTIPNAYAACADGCYTAACQWGFDDCNMNPMDGCETSVLSDKNNCGGCGKPCANLANAMSTCANGSCMLTSCNQGFADCDNNPQTGCEVNIFTSANNCGKCGNVCPQGLVCTNGGCTCPQCNFPNATSVCINNVCKLDKCNAGYGNCDNNDVNGCEVDLQYDANNCSSCGTVCPMISPFCNMAMCSNVNPAVIYTGNFTVGQTPIQQCTDWKTFQGKLVMNYTSVTIKGSNDNTGVTCQGNGANQLCQALRMNQSVSVMCNGRTWRTGPCGGGTELSATGNICQCDMPGYLVRPCIGNNNWGGVNTATCNGPTQTMTVICQ
jgi:hypothetical protein